MFLASSSRDNRIKIWDLMHGNIKFTFDSSNGGHSSFASSLVSLKNGYLASGSYENRIKIWDLALLLHSKKKFNHVNYFAFS